MTTPSTRAEQAIAYVVEHTGLPRDVVLRVTEAFDAFWREREPALLTAMNARLDSDAEN